MKRIHIFLVSLLFLLTQTVLAQNAPATTAGNVLNASAGYINIPLTVTNFENIGSITLTLNYNPAVMTYVSSTANPAFPGIIINGSTAGQINIGWSADPGAITLPDGSLLAELEFTFISGSTSLSWDNTSNGGQSCEYTDGSFNILNDAPTADYYTDGYIISHAAPVTYAPTIIDAEAGAINVPVTVDNFLDIGAIALTFEYNPNILTFTGSTPHTAFGTMSVTSSPISGSKHKVVISWSTGYQVSPVTLVDGSTIVDLSFNYSPNPMEGNYSELIWVTDGTACEYGDEDYYPLFDFPFEDFYIDGLVAGQVAPGTYLPEITDAVPGSISVPVTVVDFQSIGAVALIFEYDASVISYVGYTPNAGFGGILSLNDTVIGGKDKIVISYYGSPVTISDLDYIADIEFNYSSGTTTLTWETDGTACEYGDALSLPLWDNPYEDYYFDGLVASQVAPTIKADSMVAVSATQISVPLSVWGFTNISSLTLTLDYDPGVLTYIDATPHPDIASSFNEGASNPGRITMGWFNNSNPYVPISLPDETALIYLNFTYNGGTSPLIWYDNGGSCEFAAGSSITILYDQPTEDYYINGLVEEHSPAPPIPHIWTGTISTDWNIPDNWYSFLVPISLTDVSILLTLPDGLPSPPHWPVFTGDFTLGVQCKSIDLGDGTEMSVTGDMIINPGHAFINEGSGVLRVGGSWLNSGIFVPGTGEVNFILPGNGSIPADTLPANEVQNYLLLTSSSTMTPISGGAAGPTGDNAHSDVSIGFTFNYAGTDYTQVRINTNGWLSMNLSGEDLTSNANIWLFDPVVPVTALAPWWDDLKADGSSGISYLTSGTAPNRVFTVEWNDVLSYSSGATARLNFQVKLYETTNVVEFCYGSVTAGTHNVIEAASIGIKGPVGGTGDFIEATTGSTNIGIINLKSSTDWPIVNYEFIPPQDTITFYKISVSDNVNLNVQTHVKAIGVTP